LLTESLPGIVLAAVDRIVVVRLHLLDGTYELFRAFYGRPMRQAPDGREVGATLGVIETTLALLREPEVSHLAAATDTVIESFRNDMFAGYKTGAGVDPLLMSQFPLVERAFATIGVVCWGMLDYEADDAIATAAWRWCEDVEQVVICTPDKDMAQCVVGDRVVTFNRREQKFMNEAGVHEKFGIAPESIPDYLALVGDTADGVPGLKGWGPKSAATVLARYRKLEAIPDRAADWEVTVRGAAGLAATLAASRREAHLYRELTTLRVDAPLQESLADLEWRGADRQLFAAMCDELGVGEDTRQRPHRWRP
jgi:5'-3' exonuclease